MHFIYFTFDESEHNTEHEAWGSFVINCDISWIKLLIQKWENNTQIHL